MATTGVCPRCGANMEAAQEGGLSVLKCSQCGHMVQVAAPGSMEAQWMGMISQMSQQGFTMPQVGQELTPERKQAIIEQVRASMGDAMAAQVARTMGIAPGSGMATGQPMVVPPAATMQQLPGAQTFQGWPSAPTAQANPASRLLIMGIIVAAGACLILAGPRIVAMMLRGEGILPNLTFLAALLNRLLASFGMPPMTGFSVQFGGGFLLGGAACLLVAGIGGIRAFMARSWPTAEGVVLSAVVYRRGAGRDVSYQPEIRYQYQVGERSYVGNRLAFGSRYYRTDQPGAHKTAARYPEGSAVRVHYNPSQPENAVLEVRFDPAGLLMVLGVVFSVLGVAGFIFGGFVP